MIELLQEIRKKEIVVLHLFCYKGKVEQSVSILEVEVKLL